MQTYKNIYFFDCPGKSSGRASLTLAFGVDDQHVYEVVRHVSSETMRRALGYQSYEVLRQAAVAEKSSINAYCLAVLRQRVNLSLEAKGSFLPGFEGDGLSALDPIQATFNGGRHEPLHEWYPYLEGYSPAFVESIFGQYCPDARSVLDPFGGGGTTPLTAAKLGLSAFYAEVNPLMQFLTESKIIALQLRDKERRALVSSLRELESSFDDLLTSASPDEGLRRSYVDAFGDSIFFERKTLSDVLRARSLIDSIHLYDQALGRLLLVAVLRSLIPASNLIRRGDLRFKTPEEAAKIGIKFRRSVIESLAVISRDIECISSVYSAPVLVLENSKNLGKLPSLDVDCIITSPPYLNGTNYFRNTKLELWFLRCLRTKKDLAQFRFRAVTAGINDVTSEKLNSDIPSLAREVQEKLNSKAYDARIPRMVACFATEMHSILQSLATHTAKNGKIVIDIGDSAYAGVHVPTDKIIEESLATAGFELGDELILRQRLSRDQTKLSQKLLVFERTASRRAVRNQQEHLYSWSASWNRFKTNLPHQKGDFSKRNWGHPLHSLCSYQGKMKPSLASHLVRAFTSPGDRLLDPFSGVGTIPFEAAMHGVYSCAFDISPPALSISAAKVGRPQPKECAQVIRRLEEFLQSEEVSAAELAEARSIHFNGALESYFEANSFREILLARRFFQRNAPDTASESLVLASLLHILHGNRPYALSRRSHPITPFAPTGEAEYRALIPRLEEKVMRSFATPLPACFKEGKVFSQDATTWWPAEVDNLDAIITSPPFFDSTRFYLGNWMRLWFCGWQSADFQRRPMAFIDERQKRGFDVYQPIFRQCRERLKAGGVAVFHLGVSKKCAMAEELAKIAKSWFRVADIYTESVSHCESHGIRDKGAVSSHQYLVLL